MKHHALLATGLLITASWASGAELSTVRVDAPATLLRAGNTAALLPAAPIVAGDVVSAGSRGKVALRLADHGAITLSSLGDLQVFEASAARGKLPASAKLKLLAGALRVDSRASNGRPAQDLRLNIGSLKTRILNADAWGANTAEGDTLCLIAGAVSVQTEGGDERLSTVGSCLRREPDGQLSRFSADSDPVILGAIAATRFEGAAMPPAATIATVVSAPSPSPSRELPPAPGGDMGGDWTIVVLSLSKPEPVAVRARALVQQGLPATTRTATVNGVTMHRVAIGSFATQAEARAYAASTLAKSDIKGWPARL